jgi:hypothetical protein
VTDSSDKPELRRQFRGIWWFVGFTAAGALALQGIRWSRGEYSLPDVLTPAGLLAIAAANLSRQLAPRLVLMWLGTVAVLTAIWLRYFH